MTHISGAESNTAFLTAAGADTGRSLRAFTLDVMAENPQHAEGYGNVAGGYRVEIGTDRPYPGFEADAHHLHAMIDESDPNKDLGPANIKVALIRQDTELTDPLGRPARGSVIGLSRKVPDFRPQGGVVSSLEWDRQRPEWVAENANLLWALGDTAASIIEDAANRFYDPEAARRHNERLGHIAIARPEAVE
jgi:hypothetical protein